MVIEQLTFLVPPGMQERFLALDHAIWTRALAAQPEYIGKEVWREAELPERLHLIIRWQSRAAWKAVPTDLLAETDRQFTQALGTRFEVLTCLDQDVVTPQL